MWRQKDDYSHCTHLFLLSSLNSSFKMHISTPVLPPIICYNHLSCNTSHSGILLQPPILSPFFLSSLSLFSSSNYTLKVTLWICSTCYHGDWTGTKLSRTPSVTLQLCWFNLNSPLESHQQVGVQCKQTASLSFLLFHPEQNDSTVLIVNK